MLLPSQPTPIRLGQGHLRGAPSRTQVASGWLLLEQLFPSTATRTSHMSRLARASPEISSQSLFAVFRFTWPTGWTGLPQITPWNKSLFPSKAPAGWCFQGLSGCLLVEPTSVSTELHLGVLVYFPSNSQVPLCHQDATTRAPCPL